VVLDGSTESARAARRFVAEVLGRIGREDVIGDATLCTSELVTNAIRYSPGGCEIAISERDGAVRIEVHDSSQHLPRPSLPSPVESGRGMAIIGSLSSRWGVEVHRGDGKSVWCQLDRR
jgi:anti-sigma regulatory factor (Ser/Thr protein kinase)